MPKKPSSQVVDLKAARAGRAKEGGGERGRNVIGLFLTNVAGDPNFGVDELIRSSSPSQNRGAIEYKSSNGTHIRLEARSFSDHGPREPVHELFGELMKGLSESRSGKRSSQTTLGILIPLHAANFYRQQFKQMPKSKFLEFGKMVDASVVFCAGPAAVYFYSWIGFYDGEQPVLIEPRRLKQAS